MQKLLIENENYKCEIKHKEEHAKQEEDCDNEYRTKTSTRLRTHAHTDTLINQQRLAISGVIAPH